MQKTVLVGTADVAADDPPAADQQIGKHLAVIAFIVGHAVGIAFHGAGSVFAALMSIRLSSTAMRPTLYPWLRFWGMRWIGKRCCRR